MTYDRETLLALAGRCEKAEGADRDLNYALLIALGWGRDEGYAVNPHGQRTMHVPDFTASLDAAMTLVPEGWGWSVSQPNEKAIASGLLKRNTPVMGEVQYGCDHRYPVAAATPSLALTAACLRARAASLPASLPVSGEVGG